MSPFQSPAKYSSVSAPVSFMLRPLPFVVHCDLVPHSNKQWSSDQLRTKNSSADPRTFSCLCFVNSAQLMLSKYFFTSNAEAILPLYSCFYLNTRHVMFCLHVRSACPKKCTTLGYYSVYNQYPPSSWSTYLKILYCLFLCVYFLPSVIQHHRSYLNRDLVVRFELHILAANFVVTTVRPGVGSEFCGCRSDGSR